MATQPLISMLARCFLAGDPAPDRIVERSSRLLGRPWSWLGPLSRRYARFSANRVRPRKREVVRFLLNDAGFQRACLHHHVSLQHWMLGSQQMQPLAASTTWGLPTIETTTDLAKWLTVTSAELEWFADLRGLSLRATLTQLRHYNYRVLAKDSASIRLIECPKCRLKTLQRQILTGILEKIPLHRAIHGFCKGRSVNTFTAPHVGQPAILRMDLRDFFPCISAARVQAFFRTIGYPEPVSDLLGALCTTATPRHIWNAPIPDLNPAYLRDYRVLYTRRHLPQGAPTSPLLANLCFYRADCRLSGLARASGVQYTRYADDLAFSGPATFAHRAARFSLHVASILSEEGFVVSHRKTRVMRGGVRQHLAGLVINHHANVPRPDFDLLKATLTNCARLGPESQNRQSHPQFRAHLEGRVAYLESINPAKALRLRSLFNQINWGERSGI